MPTVPKSKAEQSLSSGIQTSSSGERHIPQSTRADGSVRKEIKIRPGYRPPEDVEVYKNRTAEAFKNRGKGGIPGAEGLQNEINANDSGTAAANRSAKRREARKRAKAAGAEIEMNTESEGAPERGTNGDQNEENVPPHLQSWRRNERSTTTTPQSNGTSTEDSSAEAEREKSARNLKKKLRQARELKEKKDSGGDLLPEQFAKVIKIQELIRQLDALGFDENGDGKEEKPKHTS